MLTVAQSALAARGEGAFSLGLAQELDLPAAFRLGFLDEQKDFAPAVAEARDPGANPSREAAAEITAVLPAADAEARARSILADAWVMRETLEFELPPSELKIEPGDAIILSDLGTDRRYRITEIEDGAARRAELVRVSPAVYEAPVGPTIFTPPASVPVFAAPVWELMDLPLFADGDDPAKTLVRGVFRSVAWRRCALSCDGSVGANPRRRRFGARGDGALARRSAACLFRALA